MASSPLTGTALTSDSPLRIGGNAVWPEWFAGLIDEVRVYNRALTPAEIATDRDTRDRRRGARPARSTRSAAVRVVPRRHTRNADRLSPRTRRKVHRGTHWLKNRRPVARHRPGEPPSRRRYDM